MVPFAPRASVLDTGDVQTHKQLGLEKFVDTISGVTTRVT